MIRKITFCIVLYVFYGLSYAQQKEIDSLYKIINSSDDIKVIASAHANTAWHLLNINTNHSKVHMDSAYILYKKLEDTEGIVKMDYRYGVLYRKLGDFDLAISSFNSYQEYFLNIQDTFSLANVYYQKGATYQAQGDYLESLVHYYKALNFYRLTKSLKSEAFTLNGIGVVYKDLKQYDNAFSSYSKSIEINKALSDKENLANVYGNLGNLFSIKQNFNKALFYQNNALSISTELNSAWGTSHSNLNIGSIYIEKQEYKKAEKHLNLALDIQIKNNLKERAETLQKLGLISLNLSEHKKSKSFLNEALKFSPSKVISKEIHRNLSILYQKQGNNKLALTHFKTYHTLADSILDDENNKDINRLKFQFETEQKNSKIAQQNLIIKEQENVILISNAKYGKILVITIASLLTLLFLFIFYSQRQKLKNNEIVTLKTKQDLTRLESLIEGEEKERTRLAQDLHDGINGDLSAIKYKITSMETTKLNRTEKKEFNGAVVMLDNAIEQVRLISHNLVPPSLQNFDLNEAITQYCTNISASNTISIDFQEYGKLPKLDKETETAIYRIFQETINNIIKHSKATHALVQINMHDDIIHMTIEDNGIGFDTDGKHKGLGLKNMQSRIAYLKGELVIDSSKSGTSIQIHINLNNLS